METKRKLYYEPKCLCGVPVVTACHIFAIINATVVCMLALCCIAYLGFLIFLGIMFGGYWIGNSNNFFAYIAMFFIVGASYIGMAIAAIFASLLLMGIRRKKPILVKAYLVYAVIVEMVLILSTFIFIGVKSQQPFGPDILIYGSAALGVCVVHGFLVGLVNCTYVVLRNRVDTTVTDVQVLCVLETGGQLPFTT